MYDAIVIPADTAEPVQVIDLPPDIDDTDSPYSRVLAEHVLGAEDLHGPLDFISLRRHGVLVAVDDIGIVLGKPLNTRAVHAVRAITGTQHEVYVAGTAVLVGADTAGEYAMLPDSAYHALGVTRR